MPVLQIAPIVEGHGEVQAVPVLLRRLAAHIAPSLELKVLHPIRRSRDKIVQDGELEADVKLAAGRLNARDVVLVFLDADDSCPATLGPRLRNRAHAVRADIETYVVIIPREFEAWFLASAESLAGQRGLRTDLVNHPNAESVTGAKEWLRANMQDRRTYSETIDQPAFCQRFSFELARLNSPSFERFYSFCQAFFTKALSNPPAPPI